MTLQIGSSGVDVKNLQTKLNQLGYNCGVVDGSFGVKTQIAVKAFQAAHNLTVDGIVGDITITAINNAITGGSSVVTTLLNGMPAIVCNDIVVVPAPKLPLQSFANSINGSFFGAFKSEDGTGIYNYPVAICVSDGRVICPTACHSDQGYPETTMYKTKAGSFGCKLIRNQNELQQPLQWAVGGVGLLSMFNPSAEGFKKTPKGDFSDVLRVTDHSMIGYRNGKFYLVLCRNMSATEVNNFAISQRFVMAIMMDGGHIAAINGSEAYAKIKLSMTQNYVLQGI